MKLGKSGRIMMWNGENVGGRLDLGPDVLHLANKMRKKSVREICEFRRRGGGVTNNRLNNCKENFRIMIVSGD